jgi:predicted component of type VI protein secretion system
MYVVSKISEFIVVELDLAPRREFAPHDLFYKCAKLQKIMEIRKYLFQGSKQSKSTQFQTL